MPKSLRAQNRKPTHPGALLREDVLPGLNMTQSEIADALGVSRRTISQILNEHRPVTPDMAKRLEYFLGTPAETWLTLQHTLDLWHLDQDKTKTKEYAHIPCVTMGA
jgi:addiction module HigA family antidote